MKIQWNFLSVCSIKHDRKANEEVVTLVIVSGKKEKTSKELIEHIILEKYNHYYRLAFSYTHNEEDAKDIVQNGGI